jgi:hypothetical protein
MKQLAIWVALAVPLAASACITEETSNVVRAKPGSNEQSYGAVVQVGLQEAWDATQRVLLFMANGEPAVDSTTMQASAMIQGAEVTVQVEPYNSLRTILRVGAKRGGEEDRAVADRVLQEIMALIQR